MNNSHPDSSITPSPTIPVMVVLVNGEGITQLEFESHRKRFQSAQVEFGPELAAEDDSDEDLKVLGDLINRLLLAQAARENGFTISEEIIQKRVDNLIQTMGSETSLAEWQTSFDFTPESFHDALALEIEAAWMREYLTSNLPSTAEQVLARQVLLSSEVEAQRLYFQLENGASFDQIVTSTKQQNLGYLGWFPRGYLIYPQIEDVAFSLQPGQYSKVITTNLGYHIIEVTNRDSNKELSSDAVIVRDTQFIHDWIIEQRAQSQIKIQLP